jgi:acyl-CoA synthetase (AMP-forming)/AMP-acid ligase II
MARRTLIDFFDDFSSRPGDFIQFDDGYRGWTYTYAELMTRARGFAARLRASGITSGDKVLIWSENRPEWIVALWGCLLEGVVLVPIDYRASTEFLLKVAEIVDARLILVGDSVSELATPRAVWPLATPTPDLSVAPDLKVGPTSCPT